MVQNKFWAASLDRRFRVTSGGELQVSGEVGAEIRNFAQNSNDPVIIFSTSSLPLVLADMNDLKTELRDVQETTRDTIISARIGQGLFRQQLFKVYKGKCAITGIDVPEILRASHIKTWCKCNSEERLCVENGLLLIADLDAAFDAKLISFKDNGEIIFSPKLGKTPHQILGKQKKSRLSVLPSDRQIEFLKVHREAAGFQ